MRRRTGTARRTRLGVAGFGVFLLLLLPCASVVYGGIDLGSIGTADPLTGLLPFSGRASLLDPSKLQISHQAIFSYSSASGRDSDVGGLWLTKFKYELSRPLVLDFALGSALTSSGLRGTETKNLFLESFSLRYRPSDNFYFLLMYRDSPHTQFYFPEDYWRSGEGLFH